MSGTPAVAACVLMMDQAVCRLSKRPRCRNSSCFASFPNCLRIDRYLCSQWTALLPIGMQRSLLPLPWHVSSAASSLTSLVRSPHSSDTRKPAAYITSIMARSRTPMSVLMSGASSKRSISSSDKNFGNREYPWGVWMSSAGWRLTWPSSMRKLKNPRAALTDLEIEDGARPSRDMRAIHSRKSLRSSFSTGLWFVSAHECSFAMSRA